MKDWPKGCKHAGLEGRYSHGFKAQSGDKRWT